MIHIRKLNLGIGCLLFAMFACMAMVSTVEATTRTVGLGGASPNYTSISNALAAASDGDVIQIVTNVQTECGIVIANSVTIQGQGMTNTILQGAATRSNAYARVFYMNNTAKSATIQNMTIQYGFVSNNTGYAGAALYNYAGTVTVQNCAIVQNDGCMTASSSPAGGGAFAQNNNTPVYQSLTIKNCLIASNAVVSPIVGVGTTSSSGGGIYCYGGSLWVEGCTFAWNTCYGNGGAIYVSGSPTSLTVRSSTFFQNTAGGNGGAIDNAGVSYGGTGVFYNCTIYSNATTGAHYGGGIYIYGYNKLVNCIVATNSYGTGGGNADIYQSSPNNVFSNCMFSTSVTVTNGGGGNCLTNSSLNLKLGPLAYNGGVTPTLALLSGSPCIDTGCNVSLIITNDQRGYPYERLRGAAVDMGAYEYGAGATLTYSGTNFNGNTTAYDGSIVNSLTISLSVDTFSGTDGSQLTNNVTVTNLPAGLTLSLVRTNSGTAAVATLLGNATQHHASNTVNNLGFTFQNGAFTYGYASQDVNDSVTNLNIIFTDPVSSGSLTYSGTNFYEDAVYNDGRISNTVSVVLSGDQFAVTSGNIFSNSQVTLSNVPVGLTGVVTCVNSTNASIALTGRAITNAFANSITNLIVAFQNTAFVGNNASVLTGSSTNLDVTFLDPYGNVQLTYGGTVFNESTNNDGSIGNTLNIVLSNDTFTGNNNDNFVGGKVQVTNLPSGLTATVTRASITNVTVSLTGYAQSHDSVNNVNNLTLAFQNSAFENTAASQVTNSTMSTLKILFLNPALTYSGTNFVAYWQNDGSVGTTLTITLAGDTFTGNVGDNLVSLTKATSVNVPPGLTASVVLQSANTALFSLVGNATVPRNSVTNMGLVFQDTAFTMGNANLVTNGSVNNITLLFPNTSGPTNFYVNAATGNDTTGNGTITNPWKSIRAAVNSSIVQAHTNNCDTINIAAGTYNETNLIVSSAIILSGAGAASTIVQACPSYPIGLGTTNNQWLFDFVLGASLNGLTLQYGCLTNAIGQGIISSVNGLPLNLQQCVIQSNVFFNQTYSYYGYSVFLTGAGASLTMSSCQLLNNRAITGVGGAGIYLGAGSSLLSNCVLSGNQSLAFGGAMSCAGNITMQDCLIANNTGVQTLADGGGGVCESTQLHSNNFLRCTFAGNQCLGTLATGGGLWVASTTVVVNCTFYGNVASNGTGGGLYVYNGNTMLYNSTFANNVATNGGGIYNEYAPTWSAFSTLIAGNIATNSPDVGGNYLLNDSYCLIGNNTNINMGYAPPAGLPNAHNSYVGTSTNVLNPQLLPLTYNGGITPTCALPSTSLAVNHGSNPLGMTTDQRGTGYPRLVGLAVDIGAYEYAPPAGTTLIFW